MSFKVCHGFQHFNNSYSPANTEVKNMEYSNNCNKKYSRIHWKIIKFKEIIYLNQNHFTGVIPKSFRNLKNLRRL
ncbi:hypothetical protein H8356DRAFT_1331544 [Neocallimastix lanati (nom. inval.)]|nr:hypothetical protein H8356DRAFT_1331544 [Neocallimastix sp. JGI-2020a]